MTICLFICTIAFYGFTSLISKTYFSNLVLLGFDSIKKNIYILYFWDLT